VRRGATGAAALAAACGIAAAVAHAADVHTLKVTATPAGSGSAAAPQAKKLVVDYTIAGAEGRRPAPLRAMKIAMAGVVVQDRAFPRCTLAQADDLDLAAVLAACGKAQVGAGRVELVMGLAHEPADVMSTCSAELRVFNLGRRRLALRFDRKAEEDCLMDPQMAIRGKLRRTRLGGRPTDAVAFEIPEVLRHPLEGLDLAVVRLQATLSSASRRTAVRGQRRRVGFYSAVGCAQRRLARVTVVDEAGAATRTQLRVRC
jgi:hypothetical protein